MPTSGLFVSSTTSQIPVQTIVSSVPVQLIVTVGTINVPIGSAGHPLIGQYVPPPIPSDGGKQPHPPYVPLVSGLTYVSGSQTHATKVNQNVGSVPDPSGSSIPSRLGQIPVGNNTEKGGGESLLSNSFQFIQIFAVLTNETCVYLPEL